MRPAPPVSGKVGLGRGCRMAPAIFRAGCYFPPRGQDASPVPDWLAYAAKATNVVLLTEEARGDLLARLEADAGLREAVVATWLLAPDWEPGWGEPADQDVVTQKLKRRAVRELLGYETWRPGG